MRKLKNKAAEFLREFSAWLNAVWLRIRLWAESGGGDGNARN